MSESKDIEDVVPDIIQEDNIVYPDNEEDTARAKPYKYEYLDTIINGKKEKIHMLEVDISDSSIDIRPALSFGVIYGFEELSVITNRENALASTNGGFFHEYGEPGGMVMIDGVIYTGPTGRYPTIIINQQEAYFDIFSVDFWIEKGDEKISVNNINVSGWPGAVVVYTPKFGDTNRAELVGRTVVIEKNKVLDIVETDQPVNIPADGFLVTFFCPYEAETVNFHKGQHVSLNYHPFLGEKSHAYECGSWLVKDGEVVAKESDPWVGVLTNSDPRTAIGLKDEHTIVLIVVDGRQPDFSEGLTAEELAIFLKERGVKEAAMLDGGASSEMIIEGEIVNRPSYNGKERKMAGAIVVKKNE